MAEVASKSNWFFSSFRVILIVLLLLVDTNELQRVLNEIKGRVNGAQTDLDNAKSGTVEATPGDRFVNAMEVSDTRDDDHEERLS